LDENFLHLLKELFVEDIFHEPKPSVLLKDLILDLGCNLDLGGGCGR
jgi:hypothetical protein